MTDGAQCFGQGYPLWAAALYVAGAKDKPHRERTCQDGPAHDDIALCRVIGWRMDPGDGCLPITITYEHGEMFGWQLTLHDSKQEAEGALAEITARIDAFWDKHDGHENNPCPRG